MNDDFARERYRRLLIEQDEPEDEALRLATALKHLDAWQIEVGPEETDQLLRRIQTHASARGVRAGIIRAERDRPLQGLMSFLAMVASQVQVIRPEFWALSLTIATLGLLVLSRGLQASLALALWLVGPLLALLAVHVAFAGPAGRMIEIELACPPSPTRLVVARLVVVLGYEIAVMLLVSVGLAGLGGGEPFFTVLTHWLAPMFLVAGLELILGTRLLWLKSGGLAYLIWVGMVLFLANVPEQAGVHLLLNLELWLLPAGLILLAVAVGSFRSVLSGSRGRPLR